MARHTQAGRFMRGHVMALARLVAAVIDKLTLTNWGAPQTTNLGIGGSNPSGRAIKSMIFRNAVLIARQSHGRKWARPCLMTRGRGLAAEPSSHRNSRRPLCAPPACGQ